MKAPYLLLTAFLFSLATYAQKADQLLIRVNYTFVKKSDTLPSGKQRMENMLLFVGRNISLFTSYDKLRHEVSEDEKFRMAAASGSVKKVTIIDSRPTEKMSKTDYFYFVKENNFVTKEIIALQPYLIVEKAEKINWKMSKDTLSFSGVKCFKATADVDGRPWTAWYSPAYPFPMGPWKLYGLPGLIIEAHDDDNLIKFQFAGIENATEGDFKRTFDVTKRPNAHPGDFNPVDQMIGRDVATAFYENKIQLPVNGVRTSKKDFEQLKSAFEKDPKGFVRTQSGY